MNPSTKTITAPAKERSRSAHGSSTITTTSNKHVSKVNGKPIKISTNLGTIIYNIEAQFGKLSDLVDQAFKVGKQDGLSEKIIGDLVRAVMKKAKYNRHTFAVLVRDKYPGALQKGHKSGTKSATSGKVSNPTKNVPPATVTAIPTPTAIAAATTIEPVKNDSEDVFAKTYRVRNPFKFEFDPEEKTFEELLTFETDVPRFPPELLLKYTIRLAKVSREKVRQLNAQLEDFTKSETMSAQEKENEELRSRVNDDDGAKQ